MQKISARNLVCFRALQLGLLIALAWLVAAGSVSAITDLGGVAASCSNTSQAIFVVEESDPMEFRRSLKCANNREQATVIELKGDITFSELGVPPRGIVAWYALYLYANRKLTIRKSPSSAGSSRVKIAISESVVNRRFSGNVHFGLGIFLADSGSELKLENVTLQGGYFERPAGHTSSNSAGSALGVLGRVTLRNCLITNNKADSAVVYVATIGSLNIYDSIITGNEASRHTTTSPKGAAIYGEADPTTISVSGQTRQVSCLTVHFKSLRAYEFKKRKEKC